MLERSCLHESWASTQGEAGSPWRMELFRHKRSGKGPGHTTAARSSTRGPSGRPLVEPCRRKRPVNSVESFGQVQLNAVGIRGFEPALDSMAVIIGTFLQFPHWPEGEGGESESETFFQQRRSTEFTAMGRDSSELALRSPAVEHFASGRAVQVELRGVVQ